MARRKIAVAMMMHETNTFSPVPTPLSSFRPLAGAAAIEEFTDTNTQLGGFLHVAREIGAEITVPIAAGAHPSGYVERAAYEDMADAIVGAIPTPSPARPCRRARARGSARRARPSPPCRCGDRCDRCDSR